MHRSRVTTCGFQSPRISGTVRGSVMGLASYPQAVPTRATSSADSKLSSTARSRMGPGLASLEFAGVKDIYDPVPVRGEVSPALPFVCARLLIVRPFMDGRPKSAMLPSVVPDVFGVRLMRWQATLQVSTKA